MSLNNLLFQTLRGHVGSITALGTDPKGYTLFSAGADSFIRFWEIKTGRMIRVRPISETFKNWYSYSSAFIVDQLGYKSMLYVSW